MDSSGLEQTVLIVVLLYMWVLPCKSHTGGVVADMSIRAGASLVVGEYGSEVGVATHAGKWAGSYTGVTERLHSIIPLYERHVVLHQWHSVPHHGAVTRSGLLHPDVLWRTWVCQRETMVLRQQ